MKFFAFIILGVFCTCAYPSEKIKLSDTETAYLKNINAITMCVDPDWEPFEQIVDKKHVGIAADIINLISSRLNVKIELIQTKGWEESIEFSKQGKCDILSFLNQTPKREEWLTFTEPIFKDPNVLIGRTEASYIDDVSKIKASIALPRQTAMSERFAKDFPNLVIIPVDSEREAFKLVEDKKADLTLRSMIVAAHTIKKEGLFNLKIIGEPHGYENVLRIGVTKDKPIIRDILNKGIATVTREDTNEIINKHVVIIIEKINYITPRAWLFIGLTAITAALFLVILHYRKQFYHTSETANIDPLTGLFNRKKLDSDLQKLIAKGDKNQKPSLILLDIDNFKKINDTFGHDIGDIVIKSIADTLKTAAVQNSSAYRWGGEEFLVIAESQDIESLVALAEKIRCDIEQNSIDPVGNVTCSFGLSRLEDEDTMISLFKRADNNLYKAKSSGKNVVIY